MAGHENCQRARQWLIGLFTVILIAVGSGVGSILFTLKTDLAVVKEKVTAIEKIMTGHLVPRDNTAARNMKGMDNEERTDLAAR